MTGPYRQLPEVGYGRAMDFAMSPRTEEYRDRLLQFMDEKVYPAEPVYHEQRRVAAAAGDEHAFPAVMEELKIEARKRGLWNLFLPDSTDPPHGLKVHEYARLSEITGWSVEIAPQALNCSAPDTGNMETLHLFGTPAQKQQWLQPLLDGEIRSAFAMTEPDVASSDASNISISIVKEGAGADAHFVINGRKWWISGAADARCKVLILMGKTDPNAASHRQQSMILVPTDTPGLEIVRSLPVFGFQDQHGHCELRFTDVRVPVSNLLGEEGGGFAIAQARLGPGRIHHCMRAIGMAERALKLMCERAVSRHAFGKALADQGTVQADIAMSRMEIDQARLLVLQTAWMIDTYGAKAARNEIASIKVVVPQMVLRVIDRAIQVHGGGGVTEDFPLAGMWAHARTLRIVDGPDAVHIRSVARAELAPYRPPR
jgi:acyl-CoA dehydrogenase